MGKQHSMACRGCSAVTDPRTCSSFQAIGKLRKGEYFSSLAQGSVTLSSYWTSGGMAKIERLFRLGWASASGNGKGQFQTKTLNAHLCPLPENSCLMSPAQNFPDKSVLRIPSYLS